MDAPSARRNTTTLHLFRTDGMISPHTRAGDEVVQLSTIAARFLPNKTIHRITVTRDLGPISVTVYDSASFTGNGLSRYTQSRHDVEVYACALHRTAPAAARALGEALTVAMRVEAGPYSPMRATPAERASAGVTLLAHIAKVPERIGMAIAIVAAGMRTAY